MTVQVSQDSRNRPVILDQALAVSKDSAVIKMDAARTAPLERFTLLSQVAADGKYVPFTDETATDGTAIPSAIYLGTGIAAETLAAGDVQDAIVLLGGSLIFSREDLIIEGSKLTTTVIGAGTLSATTVEGALRKIGIFLGAIDEISNFEN